MQDAGGCLVQLEETNQVLIGKYRRNRKLQSCEPCRKSKLACDHSVPCGRCRKRRRVDSCFYHPNPLTRNRTAGCPTPSSSGRFSIVQSTEEQASETAYAPEPLSTSHPTPAVVRSFRPGAVGEVARGVRASSAPPLNTLKSVYQNDNPGFLGATASHTMLFENLDKLGVFSSDLETSPTQSRTIAPERIAMGCQVLTFFKNWHAIEASIRELYNTVEGNSLAGMLPMMKQWVSQLWESHGAILESQDPEKLHRLSELIWRNTQTPVVFDGRTSPRKWIALWSGPNIRWEVVAIVAIYYGWSAIQSDDHITVEQTGQTRRGILKQMFYMASQCLTFCRECDCLNDPFVWALMSYVDLCSFEKGDIAYTTYRAGAELASAVLAMGLQHEVKADDKTPFFLAEARKRTRSLVYFSEIGTSAFLGRPPRLSYRYFNLEPALILTDEELFSEGPELAALLEKTAAKNDDSSDAQLTYMVYLKYWTGFAMSREDVLELALGNNTPDEVRRRAEAIHKKEGELWAACPRSVARIRDGEIEIDPRDPSAAIYAAMIHYGTQSSMMMLQRVLTQKAGASPASLISMTRKVFKDIMQTTERLQVSSIKSANTLHLMAVHGLRCAAILAVELLKQEQLPVYPSEPLLPRSQTIQDLSIFVAKLGTMPEINCLETLCEQGRKVITRILDKILTPATVAEKPCASCSQRRADQPAGGEFTGDLMANDALYVPNTTTLTADWNTNMDATLFGPDHQFQQWLEDMEVMAWQLSVP